MKERARENIKLVKSFYASMSRAELGTIRNLLDPEVEWIEPALPGLWFSGTRRGPETVLKEVLGPTSEKIENSAQR